MPAAGVGGDTQEDVGAVRVEGIRHREEYARSVVEGATGGDGLSRVGGRKGEHIRDLAAKWVDDGKCLPAA